jgi:copper transport protein
MTSVRRLFVLSAVVLAFVALPGRAYAHAVLASSQPQAGERLGTAPGVVVLEFTEPLNARLSRATVTDPTGHPFSGAATEGQEIRVPLSTNAPGIYAVDWVSVSTLDGHAIRGSFQFGVGVTPGVGSAERAQTAPGAGDLGIGAARWIEYLSLLVAMGMLLLRRLARGRPGLDWVRPRLVVPLALALAGGVAVVASEAFSAAGSASPGAMWSYLSTGLPGLARLSRLGLEVLALLAAIVQAPTLWVWVTAVLGAIAASGHGAAIDPAWWGITVDGVHLLAAGVWAGGILALATQRPPGGWRSDAGRELLVRFSPPALAAFVVTIGFGAIQAIQELGTVHALVGSSYGLVLVAKIGLIALMLPLSFVAWRLSYPRLRLEGTLAILVVAVAAVLAAFPIPPSRLAVEEAAARATPPLAARPQPGELTLGGHAGEVLLGLTLDPGAPGQNDVVLYLLPLEGEKEAAELRLSLSVGGTELSLERCGQTCRRTRASFSGGERVSVHIHGSRGGTAVFRIPRLPTPDGTQLLAKAQQRMHQLHAYRIDETLSSGRAVVTTRYVFEAPDRMEATGSGGGSQIIIDTTRYLRERPGAKWQPQQGGPPFSVPTFIWDYFKPFVDVRVVGTARVGGVRTRVISFTDGQPGTPIWFRLWIDPTGLVRQAQMRAPGHFMDHRLYDFDGPIDIKAPVPG